MPWIFSGFSDEAGDSAEEQIAALASAGLRHIDVRSVDGFNITQLPLEDARVLRGKFDEAGIAVNMLGSPIGKVDITDDFEPELTRLDHVAAVANLLGSNRIRIFSYYNRSDVSQSDWQTTALRRLRALRTRAQERGMILYHENERHIFGDRVEQVLAILHELRDGKSFRAIFDFDNYNQSGEDVWESWLKLREMTDGFHLKESDADHQHMPLGQGVCRVRDILADALSRGWTGSLSLEPHLSRSPAVMATGPGGEHNQRLADLTPAQTFQYAAQQARNLLGEMAAPID